MRIAQCLHCGQNFCLKKSTSKYCSPVCGHLAQRKSSEQSCVTCGNMFRPRGTRFRIFCSRACFALSQAGQPRFERRQTRLVHSCAWCTQEFTYRATSTLARKYCSPACAAHASRTVANTHKICPGCLQAFTPRSSRHRLCSKACATVVLQTREVRTCRLCGMAFQAIITSKRTYCSKPCADEFRRGKRGHRFQIRTILLCLGCQNPFEVPRRDQHKRLYCSSRCFAQYPRVGLAHPLYNAAAHITRCCVQCGSAFRVKRAKVFAGEGRFCSRQCVGAYAITKQHGRRSSIEHLVEQELLRTKEPFFAQMPLGPWLVDFWLPRLNLVLECDGDYWHGLPRVQRRDRQKDGWLRKKHYEIVRLSEERIRQDVQGAVMEILRASPLPQL